MEKCLIFNLSNKKKDMSDTGGSRDANCLQYCRRHTIYIYLYEAERRRPALPVFFRSTMETNYLFGVVAQRLVYNTDNLSTSCAGQLRSVVAHAVFGS